MSRQSLVSRRSTACRLTATALTLLLLIQTTGCVTWNPETRRRPALQNAKPNATYRITVAEGMVYKLTHLRIQGDSLYGVVAPPTPKSGAKKVAPIPVTIPWSEVKGIERRTDHTAVALLSTVAFIGMLVLAAGNPMDNFSPGW